MLTTLNITIIIIIVIFGLSFLFFFISKSGKKEKKPIKRKKDKQSLLKEANRKLLQNPRDPEALQILASIAFEDGDYETAFKYYHTLIELVPTNPEIDEFEVTLRYAISALKIKKLQEAYKSFMIARTLRPENFEVNYNLGYLELLRKNYDKSTPLLKKANTLNPEHVDTIRYLAHSLFRSKEYAEAVKYFRKLLEYDPEDKNALFVLGQSYYELGQNENAIKIFSHLRTNPQLGPNASLLAGSLRMKVKQFDKAITDFEIGLKHENIRTEIKLELLYRLATAYLKSNNIENAIQAWTEITKINPDYKDTKDLLAKYREISANKNLQIYLMATSSEFIGLCRRIALNFFKNSVTKLTNINLHKNEYVDILAEVSTKKWEDVVLFRFVRGTGMIGELMLRDLYARMKEIKAGRGICMTAGTFSEGAKEFVEARLIDLIEGKDLLKIFNKLPQSI